ncbi:hypothetical protein H5410_037945, partial [Solanum commersonii]
MTFSWLYSSSSLVRASGHPSLDGMLHSSMEIAPEIASSFHLFKPWGRVSVWVEGSRYPMELVKAGTSAIYFLLNNQDYIKLVQV